MQKVFYELVCNGKHRHYRTVFNTFADAQVGAKQAMETGDFDYYFINATICLFVGAKKTPKG